jgi:hypothetical protein
MQTNEDLCAALNSPWLALNEAKALVKEILVSKKPISETLAIAPGQAHLVNKNAKISRKSQRIALSPVS